MSVITDLTDAVVYDLNSKTDWSVPFTAERVATARKDIRELNAISVSVIPASVQYQREARDFMRYTRVIDIGIQKHLDGNEADAVSELGSLVDEIAQYLSGRKLSHKPNAKQIGLTNDPIYFQEHLLQKRVFTSVVSVKYQIIE